MKTETWVEEDEDVDDDDEVEELSGTISIAEEEDEAFDIVTKRYNDTK